jgi:hypothetical protein
MSVAEAQKNSYPIQYVSSPQYSVDKLPIYSSKISEKGILITHVENKSQAWKVGQFFLAFFITLLTLGVSFSFNQWQLTTWREAITGMRFHRICILKSAYKTPPPSTNQASSIEHHPIPFTVLYEGKGSSLNFVAAQHFTSLTSPSHKTVKDAIEQYSPQAVIVEGFSGEFFRDKEIPYAAHRVSKGSCSESTYAVHLASKKSIDIYSGEPEDKMIYEKFLRRGLTAQDFLAINCIENFIQWNREKVEITNSLIDRYLSNLSREVNIQTSMDSSRLFSWYKEKTGETLVPSQLTTWNKIDNNPKLDEISSFKRNIRDQNLFETIEFCKKKYGRTLVVYGAYHRIIHHVALENLFGKATYKKLH